MVILRLTQDTIGEGEYQIRARFERAGHGALGGKARVEFELTAQDREDLHWYLEDYLQHPFHPASEVAARVEGRMQEIGTGLFRAIFEANKRMRQVWGEVQGLLSEMRVEIHTEVAEATAILPHASVRVGVVVCAAACGLCGVAGGCFCAQL